MPTGIAIIGIGCRFPGKANSPDRFWRLLLDGVDAIEDSPDGRFDVAELFDSDPAAPGKMYVRRGGFIEQVDQFDAAFFGISPREADYIDPQHRLLLEVTYEALEDAGLTLDRLTGSSTGVYIGIASHDYGEIQRYPGNRSQIGAHSNRGNATSIAANRLSYTFDLRGPSFAIDTACSSALTALHLACENLESNKCELALVGGSQLSLTAEPTIGFCKASMLSPEGLCRAFDAGANGYVRSEGVGIVVLKPLPAALADGDDIYAVIRGTAINQDGHTSSMTVPSRDGQAAMLRAALAHAGLEPADVDYVEAHGTGTAVGDRTETGAIGDVLGRGRSPERPCIIGSVKSNIGHLEAASGIAGLIKVALVLAHRRIPPSLHFDTPNPAIDFDGLGLRVATSVEAWPQSDRPAVAGVNSFGFGGANAHAVLQEAPRSPLPSTHTSSEPSERSELLAISARSEDALIAMAGAYGDFLESHPELPLADICGSAAMRRTLHRHRAAIVAASREDMRAALDAIVDRNPRSDVVVGRAPAGSPDKLAFVFTGMGPQWWGMGRQLMRDEPVFRNALGECDAALRPLTGWSLTDALAADEPASRMGEADVAQVANFAIQTALAALWKTWGIVPDAVIGHSAGDIAAAHVAGVYDLANAALVAHHRSRLQGRTAGQGTMLATGLSVGDAEELVRANPASVSIAAVNSPSSCTLSGDADALDAILNDLSERHVFARMMPVTIPYHSVKMDPLREELLASLRPLRPRAASIRLVCDGTGTWSDGTDHDAAYWWRNVRQPVRFAEAIATLIDDGFRSFVEIGPHPVLATAINECLAAKGEKGSVLPSLRRLDDDRKVMLRSLGSLSVQGRAVSWPAVQSQYRRYVKLPTYPWQHERHWFESRATSGEVGLRHVRSPSDHPLLGGRLPSPIPQWSAVIDGGVRPWLDDHVVQGAVVFPGAGYVEMALAAGATRSPNGVVAARGIELAKAMFLNGDGQPVLQTALDSDDRVTIHSVANLGDENWTLHARCRIENVARPAPVVPLAELQARAPREIDQAACYRALEERGLAYGKCFQGVERLWEGDKESLGRIDIGRLGLDPGPYKVHPALLDAAFQVLIAATTNTATNGRTRGLMLPVHIDSVTLYRTPGATAWSHARLVRDEPATLVGDIDLLDDDGAPLVTIRGLRCKAIEHATTATVGLTDCFYEFRWEAAPAVAAPGEREPTRLSAAPTRCAADIEASADARSVETGWQNYYRTIEPWLERLAGQLAADALRALGWNPAVGTMVSTPEVLKDLSIAPSAERLALCLMGILVEQGVLAATRDGWQVKSPLPSADPKEIKRGVLQVDPAYHTDVDLMLHCGGMLPKVLRGEADAVEVLLGSEGLAMVTRFYREVPGSAFYGKLLADAVASVVERSENARPIRILEVGAGTGGSTAHLLETLPSGRFEYLFTDVSPRFTMQARQEFGNGASFRTGLLDVEADPVGQGMAPHSVDIIVAANVLHATADLARTLAHLRTLLAPGGVLALLEITRRRRWPDIIFGITDGWWKFQDEALRPEHPLLDPQQWKTLLTGHGFEDVALIADWDHDGAPGQTVVLAEASKTTEPAHPVLSKAGWVILSDRGDAGGRLADLLSLRSDNVTLVRQGSEFRQLGPHSFEARPDQAWDLGTVLDAIGEKANEVKGVLLLGALDAHTFDTTTADALLDTQRIVCESPLAVLSALQRRALPSSPMLWLVTAGSQSAGDPKSLSVAQTPLWGLARAMMREQYDIKCRLVDLDEERSEAALAGLAREIATDAPEEEVAFRGDGRWVHRLTRITPETTTPDLRRKPAPDEGWHVTVTTPGVLSTVMPVASARREPGLGEVEIAVAASALNFRDVMLATGLMPAFAKEDSLGADGLGLDCAGTIVRCGRDVRDFKPGDAVIGIAHNALASFVTTSASLVARKPAALTFETAAAVPCVFSTAHYALEKLARLTRGERVLIHAATGGVGLAAIQVARHAGAEIFATAGSPAKRAYLESLGVHRILDSRSLAFADAVLEMTDGEGVDVVLNSLAGEAITKGIGILRPYGRFVEIGKRDIYSDSKIGLLAFRKNISFFTVDLDRMCHERPELAGEVLREVLDRFESGSYQPIPHQVFGMSEVEEAVRLMAQAKHIGKIVLKTEDPELAITVPRKAFTGEGTYLVTGGLRGFGLATVKWMVRRGVRSFVLMARSEPTPAADREIDALRAQGASIDIARGDVTRSDDVERIVQQIRTTRGPLRGVMHCATLYDDAPLAEMTGARMRNVLGPKMSGAWNLHRATKDDQLDSFVMYSSMASILGNPMQTNYCAANEFVDAFARYRRALGQPATTVHWGVLSDAGYVADQRELAAYLDRQGYRSFTAHEALSGLAELLEHDRTGVAVARIDWTRLANYFPSMVGSTSFRSFAPTAEAQARREGDGSSIRAALAQADAHDRLKLLEQYLREKVGKVLGIKPERLDAEKALTDMGLDSVIAVELVTLLNLDLGYELPVVKILQGLDIRQLGAMIAAAQPPAAAKAAPTPAPAAVPIIVEAAIAPATAPTATLVADLAPVAPRIQANGNGYARPDYATLDYRQWSPGQQIWRWCARGVLNLGASIHIEGADRLPPTGPFILASNHLSWADVPLILMVMRRPVIVMAAEWLHDRAATRWFFGEVANAIFVRRGEGDRQALEDGLAVLRTGGVLGMSPEGTRSRGGALLRARTGVAYLATRAEVPVIPMALWGHEHLVESWQQLKRPEVHIRIGSALHLPASDASAIELQQHTDQIMRALAALLPDAYRGVYR